MTTSGRRSRNRPLLSLLAVSVAANLALFWTARGVPRGELAGSSDANSEKTPRPPIPRFSPTVPRPDHPSCAALARTEAALAAAERFLEVRKPLAAQYQSGAPSPAAAFRLALELPAARLAVPDGGTGEQQRECRGDVCRIEVTTPASEDRRRWRARLGSALAATEHAEGPRDDRDRAAVAAGRSIFYVRAPRSDGESGKAVLDELLRSAAEGGVVQRCERQHGTVPPTRVVLNVETSGAEPFVEITLRPRARDAAATAATACLFWELRALADRAVMEPTVTRSRVEVLLGARSGQAR